MFAKGHVNGEALGFHICIFVRTSCMDVAPVTALTGKTVTETQNPYRHLTKARACQRPNNDQLGSLSPLQQYGKV